MAAIAFADNASEAFIRFVEVLNRADEDELIRYEAKPVRRIVGERLCPGKLTVEVYNETFEVDEVEITKQDLILATDYYGPSLSHHPTDG